MSGRREEAALLGELFRGRGEWISSGELAAGAGLPVTALAPALAPYQAAGYPIEFHPQGRVRLSEPPDIWCAEEILGRCTGLMPRWQPLLLAETASTNDVAREQALKNAPGGFVVAAARQTRGRGRQGRTWDSPRDAGLYVSLLLRPDFSASDAGRLTILSSVAMRDAVESLTGLPPQIKWPNDLVVGDRKLGGLLIETETQGKRLNHAVVGMGINVNQDTNDFSPDVRSLATSLLLVAGRSFRRADLLVALLHAMSARLAEPFEAVREAWAASSLTLGQRVMLTTLRGTRHGQAFGLDASGALLLRTETGEVEIITAGDMQAV